MTTVPSHRQPHPPLLGREREQGVLRMCLDDVIAGHGQLVLLAGEPGIGKTRLAEEAANEAETRGVHACWGHCFEWAGTPAYWPWIEIFRDLLETSDPDNVRNRLGYCAPLIAQIVPEIGEILPDLPPVPAMNPEQARFRLFDGVTRLLTQRTREQPLLLVLEDLHWADPASLLLLEFVSHEIDDLPMLVIGTYRDVEVRRDHPLASTLASLVRARTTQRLPLARLERRHIAEMIREMSGIDPPRRIIDEVYGETEGNPFFATEVIRLLVAQEHLDHPAHDVAWNVTIPASVREVIGRTLNRLSERCNEMLRVASVIGREFDLTILQRVSELSLDDLLAVLDEAIDARMVEERARVGTYRFSHTLIQETLYEELSSSRRLSLHARAGETIEREHQRNLASHYGDLARHFRLAPFGKNLEKAIDYAIQAGDQAMEQVAWESAAGHYGRAVELMEAQGKVEPARLCEMLLKLGEAQGRPGVSRGQEEGAGTDPVSRETFRRAARVARDAGLYELQAKAALGAAGLNPMGGSGHEQVREMYDALRVLPDIDTDYRARLLARLGVDSFFETTAARNELDGLSLVEKTWEWSDEALAMARRLDDPATLAYTLIMRPITITGAPGEMDLHLKRSNETIDAALRANDTLSLAWGIIQKSALLQERGDVDATRLLHEELRSIADSLRLPLIDWHVAIYAAADALRTGRYQDADYLIQHADELWPNSLVANLQRFTLRRETGKPLDESIEFVMALGPILTPLFPFKLVCLLEMGREDEARSELQSDGFETMLGLPRLGGWIRIRTLLAEVCAELQDTERAAIVYDTLVPFAEFNVGDGHHDHSGGCIAYYLGLLATTLERWDDAERHYALALERNQEWGYRPYVAYTKYGWADMLLRRGDPSDRTQATQLIADAKARAQEIGIVRLLRLIDTLERRSGLRAKPVVEGLSPRESEVLRLLVEGKSDREIADDLFISHHTVMRHVSSILRKLDVDSRGAAAVHAVRNDLV